MRDDGRASVLPVAFVAPFDVSVRADGRKNSLCSAQTFLALFNKKTDYASR